LGIEDLVEQVTLTIQDASGLELSRVLSKIIDGGQAGSQGVVLVQTEGDRTDDDRYQEEQGQDPHA
jgi:hypothetical protein